MASSLSRDLYLFSTTLKKDLSDTSMSTLPFLCDLLSPFALCVNFSHALVERHFHDYYDDSLTLPLSRVRSILSSSKCLRLYVGAHFVISCSLQAGSNESLQRK
jgi:hypothetical protein